MLALPGSTPAGINAAINEPCNNRQEALISKLVERIESLTVRVNELSTQSLAVNAINSRQSSRQPARGACFSCGQFNHRAAECPTRQTQDTCYVCGRRGHFARDCYDRFRKPKQASGKRTRADSMNGQGSAHPSGAMKINSVSPTGVFVNADVGGHMIRCVG